MSQAQSTAPQQRGSRRPGREEGPCGRWGRRKSPAHPEDGGKKERQAGRKGEFVLCLQSTDFQCGCSKCGLLFFKFLELSLCIYFERERERERKREQGKGGERERASQAGPAHCGRKARCRGLNSGNPKISTGAKIKGGTPNWLSCPGVLSLAILTLH